MKKKVVKEKVEPLQTLKVDKETHQRVRQYCDENNLWLCRFVEEVLNDYLDNQK